MHYACFVFETCIEQNSSVLWVLLIAISMMKVARLNSVQISVLHGVAVCVRLLCLIYVFEN